MSATNYTPISLYYSATASATPTSGNLVAGELALNTNDGKLFYKDSSNVVQVLATKASASNTFSAGSTGLTPSTATTGAVTLAGTLNVSSGGTGLTSLTAGYIPYGNGTSAFSSSANMTFNGTTLTLANDASISGLTVGKGGGAVASNTVVGNSAFTGNSTGFENNAFGQYAGAATTSSRNNFFGTYSGRANTSGADICAIGHSALTANTTGGQNTALGGGGSLSSNTTGSSNTGLGHAALYSNTTASNNTAVGYQAGYSNTTGTYVTAVGNQALYSNTTGSGNSAFGLSALLTNSTGANNTALGMQSLNSNTTASNNTAVGYQAGYSQAGGAIGNTLIGYQAGYTGNSFVDGTPTNVMVGYQAGYAATTAIHCTYIGAKAGTSMTTGNNNTILGSYTGNNGGLDIRTASNYIVLSDGDGNPRQVIDNSGNVGIGTSSPTQTLDVTGTTRLGKAGVDSYFSYGTNSDNYFTAGTLGVQIFRNSSGSEFMRIDTSGNLYLGTTSRFSSGVLSVAFVPGTSQGLVFKQSVDTSSPTPVQFLNAANSVVGSITTSSTLTAYNVSSDQRLKTNIVDAPSGNIDDIKVRSFDWIADGSHQEYGMVAQELLEVAPYAVHQPQDSEEMMAVDYSKLVPMMIKEIQDLKVRIATLENK